MKRSAIIIAGLAGAGLLALAIAWANRRDIARSYIDDMLTQKGVTARYVIRDIGTRTQRLEKLSLGDPANPDLTADWIEVDTRSWLTGVSVTAVRAHNVRLRGTLADGKLSLGAVDKLLPPPSDKPIELPDLPLALTDGHLALATPWGAVGLAGGGSGNLARSFKAAVALTAPRVAQGDCRADDVRLPANISVEGKALRLTGPLTAISFACAGLKGKAADVALDLASTIDLSQLSGKAGLKLAALDGQGVSGRGVAGSVDFSGTPEKMGGQILLTTQAASGPRFSAGRTIMRGPFSAQRSEAGLALFSEGTLDLSGVRPDRGILASLSLIGGKASGTPAAPIAEQLARALARLGEGSAARANYVIDQRGHQGNFALSRLSGQSTSGIRLAASGDNVVQFGWPRNGLALSGPVQISGGGLPGINARFTGLSGTAVIAPYQAGDARIILGPTRFDLRHGLALQTHATLDGPLGGGRVGGLSLPLVIAPGTNPLAGCRTVTYQSLTLQTLELAPGTLTTCISAGQAMITAPKLKGRLGSAPIAISGQSARIGLGHGDFNVPGLSVLLGGGSKQSRFSADQFSGSLSNGGATGKYAGLDGKLADVPLLISEGTGRWTLNKSILTTQGALQIADAAAERRFNPLIVNDFALRLADGKIEANGTARHPKSGLAVADIRIAHDLGAGRGHADLLVNQLAFGKALQPEELTPITLGVIANVEGNVDGRGRIDWSPGGVRSSGDFQTNGLDMAAAFGPVTGLKGRIQLSDLLGLSTSAPQSVKIAALNPGIAVVDGEISYRLLPNLKAEILGGRWPFAGGSLILEPTILDLGAAAERKLTFRVEGLDAARFIAAMEFENIAGTGIFDGELPMIFDENGGRIEGGHLVARAGGTLAYVGDISNEEMGTMGRFAFDALKSIKYSRLSIDLNGDLGGDVITRISFAGVNQAPITGIKAKLPLPIKIRGLDNFPFIFNVTITAKFRQLFDTVRSINDPSLILQREFPNLEVAPADAAKPVQPPERPSVP